MTVCDLGTANCTDPPGQPLLPRNLVRPVTHLRLTRDPLNPDRALLAWDGLQTDNTHQDVYATMIALR